MSKELTNQLVVERYKFIQEKIHFLDKMLHTNISLIVKIIIGIFTVILSIFLINLKQPTLIHLDTITLSLKISSILIGLISLIFLLMTISNILAWFDYRRDEVELLEQFGKEFKRTVPKAKNFFMWQETWFAITLLVLLISTIFIYIFSSEIVINILSNISTTL